MDKNNVPETLKGLRELSENLWYGWNYEAQKLFEEIDPVLWNKVERNPVAFLQDVSSERLREKSGDQAYLNRLNNVLDNFRSYLQSAHTLFKDRHPDFAQKVVAYFSAEFGVHESLPNYAGGLGILAGDHSKSASDLGLPLVSVGLFYKYAYFTQEIDVNGNQVEKYEALNPERLLLRLLRDEDGRPVLIKVFLKDHDVFVKIWQANVGRNRMLFLDSDVEQNSGQDREITSTLYGGSRETRIQQEIILGIGGVRALQALNLEPAVCHINEGHSAFSGLERLRLLIEKGLSFEEALEFVRNTSLFTTHTPIPAGNEAFEFDLMRAYFHDYWPQLGLSEEQFLNLGRNVNEYQHENFSLTVLALNLASMANGVSKIHGQVSRAMWKHVFPGIPEPEVPIDHITNGVHTETWLHPIMIEFLEKYFGKEWRRHIQDAHFWDKIETIPDEEFWQVLQDLRKNMSTFLRDEYRKRLQRYEGQPHGLPSAEEILNPEILTIGFARRFAPYKRATLIFRDPERLKRILNDPQRPVQILFSGKAHPHNDAGKELIRTINHFAQQEGFRGKIVFIEGYSMNISRALVAGCDVWLNNPRRPLEASGTSGQKVPINGGINLSVPDGWWPEAYNGKNGWAIGRKEESMDYEQQDHYDSESLYHLLENEVVPAFYDRDEQGIPRKWVAMAKESLRTIIHQFSTHRMVWEYTEKFYVPGLKQNKRLSADGFKRLKERVSWLKKLRAAWPGVSLRLLHNGDDDHILSAGETREIQVVANLAELTPDDVQVEIVLERQDALQRFKNMHVMEMKLEKQLGDREYQYALTVRARTDGAYRYHCRIIPQSNDLLHKHDTRLIRWLE
jgi:starch phosphorylase